LLHILEGHADNVNSVAFSPDGKILSSGSNDNTIRLWQVADGSVLGTLEGHTSWVQSVAFTMGGIMLASWSGDGTIRLWGIP
jgi:WD40 repeat protein